MKNFIIISLLLILGINAEAQVKSKGFAVFEKNGKIPKWRLSSPMQQK